MTSRFHLHPSNREQSPLEANALAPDIHSHKGTVLPDQGASSSTITKQDSAVVATQRCCALSLYRPKTTHFYNYNGAAMASLKQKHDLSTILARFRENGARCSWLSTLDKEKAISHFIGDVFSKDTYEGWNSLATIKGLLKVPRYLKTLFFL